MENNHKKSGLKFKVLIIFSLAIFLLYVVIILATLKFHHGNTQDFIISKTKDITRFMMDEIDQDAHFYMGLLNILAKDPQLKKYWLKKDRENLLKYALPTFEEFNKSFKVTHFYFHTLQGNNFLRVHNSPRFGDHIPRHSLKEAMRTEKISYGIELGPFGTFTLRVVLPWKIREKLVGYIELGEEIEHITPKLKNVLGSEITFFIHKSFLKKEKWEEGRLMLGRSGNWSLMENFVEIDSTLPFIPSKINGSLQKNWPQHTHMPFYEKINHHTFQWIFAPLMDASYRQVGLISIAHPFDAMESKLRNTLTIITVIFAISILLLSGYLYFYFNRYEKDLIRLDQNLMMAEKLASLGELSAQIAHEINNPLAIIQGYSERIKKVLQENKNKLKTDVFESATHTVGMQQEAVLKIGHIVSNLRTYARSDASLTEIVNVGEVLKNTLSMINILFEKESIRIVTKPSVDNLAFKGNSGRLQQVFVNLFTNAKDATEGKTYREITIEMERQKNKGIIKITDNGHGIPKDKQKDIFKKYFTTKAVGKGTGLGLDICQTIIKEFGGTIKVESEVMRYTTFIIELPLLASETTDSKERELKTLKGRILLVENEPLIREVLKDILEDFGLTVQEANNGMEALVKLNQEEYDGLVTDLAMPIMGGKELIYEIKMQNKFHGPIFISTGMITKEIEGYNVEGYIEKPFKSDTIYKTIEKYFC